MDCFTDSGFWKYSWAHLVMSMTESCRWIMQCRLRAQRPRASNKGLWPCSFHQCFPTLFLEAHQHCTCWMSPLSDLYISGPGVSTNELMSWFSSGWLGKVGKCVVLVCLQEQGWETLPYTEISPVSLNLLMMLCTVDDKICKAFGIWCWGTLFLKYSTIYLHSFTGWRASAHLYFWDSASL